MSNKIEIPKDWKLVKLGEYVISVKGKKPKRISNEKTKDCPLPYVNIKAFEKGIIDEYTDGLGCVICEEGDFLIVWDGSRSGYVGKGLKGALGSTLVKLNFPDIDNNYAYYFLQSKYIEINTKAKGVGIPHVDPNLLWNYELLIPPLSTQHLIVAKIEELFSELDKGIENLKLAQQQLKTYRQSVLKWAFEGKLTNAKVKEGELPKGWEWTKLGEACEKIFDGTHFSPKNYPTGKYKYITAKNIKETGIDLTKISYVSEEDHREIYARSNVKKGDVLYIKDGATTGIACVNNLDEEFSLLSSVGVFRGDPQKISSKYLCYFLNSQVTRNRMLSEISGVAITRLTLVKLKNSNFIFCPIKEQEKIVQEIESRLSVADKMEESITQSLQQAEALRQSILKQAFEGKLIIEKKPEIVKPKNVYFHQLQVLGWIAKMSKQKNISHGEMTIAKYTFLADKVYGVPTHYDFKRGHLGPYPIEMKKAINNKDYFKIDKTIEVVNEEMLFKYNNPFKDQVINAVEELAIIFGRYKGKERAHKTELLATVCKVIEDIKSTDLSLVYQSMREWPIDLKTTSCKNKAEKFTEEETQKCLAFIVARGWDKKLI